MKKILTENRINSLLFYIFTFFIPFVLMFIVYAIFRVHPFGDNSVLVLDLNGQYVYYFEALRDALWGDSSLIYSWSRNLSGEMFGIFGYYLASPFTIIPMIFPRTLMLEALQIMQLAKMGAAAVTFAVYLRHKKSYKPSSIIIFAVLYATMSYMIVQLMNPMWLDGIIYLPLIILGLEKLIDGGKITPFAIPLSLMFMANFYIGYMVGFFVVLYTLYYYFSKDKLIGIKKTLKAIAKITIGVVIAVMCASIILIPVYSSLSQGKLEFTQPDFSMKAQFAFEQFFTKLMPFSYDTVNVQGLPSIFCGCITVLLIPLFFLNKKITTRKKASSALLLASLILCMYISTIDIAWHGFQVPNWLPFRYSFTFSFVMLIMAIECFENFSGIKRKEIGLSFAGILAYILYIEGRGYSHITGITEIIPSIFFFTVFFILLMLFSKKQSKKMSVIILGAICLEMIAVSYDDLKKIDKDVVYSKYSSYQQYIADGRETVDIIEDMDNSLYRSEKTFHRTVNDPMAFGLKGLSHSSSTLNAKVINMLGKLGFTSRGHYTKYMGATPFTDSIFGVKYLLNKNQEIHNYKYLFSNKGIEVYENPYALSMGFMVNNRVSDLFLYDMNVFENQNALMDAMIDNGTGSQILKRIFPENILYENMTHQMAGDHSLYTPTVKGINAHIEYKMIAPSDDVIYAFFPSNYERTMNLWVNNNFVRVFYEGDNYSIVELGKFEKGEEFSLIATPTKEEAYIIEECFYYLDKSLLEEYTNILREGEWNITKHTDTYLEGEIIAKQNQIMFTSIPYEKGWQIEVDGKKVEPKMLLDSLIGIEVPEGKHTVTMKFMPSYFIISIIISIVGLGLMILIFIIENGKPNKNIKVEENTDVRS